MELSSSDGRFVRLTWSHLLDKTGENEGIKIKTTTKGGFTLLLNV